MDNCLVCSLPYVMRNSQRRVTVDDLAQAKTATYTRYDYYAKVSGERAWPPALKSCVSHNRPTSTVKSKRNIPPLPPSQTAARHVRCVNKMRECRKCVIQLPQYRSEEKERRVGTAELSCDRSGGATGNPLNHSLFFDSSIVAALRSTWRLLIAIRFDAAQTSTGVLVWVEPTIPPHRHEGIQGTCAMLAKCRKIGWPSGSSHC